MSEKENNRKCYKCGCSPAVDNVKLFRFPKPAIRNLLRCQLCAQYICPEGEHSSIEFQTKLHNEHRMLCQRHFKDTDFTNDSKKKLTRTAIPYAIDELPVYSVEPQAGPSHKNVLVDVTYIQNIGQSTEPTTGTSQHTQLQPLQQQKSEKDKVIYAKCRKYMTMVCRLRHRIKHLKRKRMLKIISDDMAVKKLADKITPTFALLLQGQIRNCKKKITGRRLSKEEKITALRIYKRSPTCYRLLRRLFHLPSPSSLKILLSKVPFSVGANQPVFKILKEVIETQKPSDNEYTLMFDEMSLKKHLDYNSKEDKIEGYQDHGSQGRSPLIAAYALVFMIAEIRRRVKQPIAHYFSSGFATADRLAVLIKEVLYQCFQFGINIAAIVCDMDGVNRRALAILGASVEHPFIMVNNREIITLFDPPHLLKCFRNLFMKYDIECTVNISSGDRMGRGVAKWSHIKEFYEADNNNPKLFSKYEVYWEPTHSTITGRMDMDYKWNTIVVEKPNSKT